MRSSPLGLIDLYTHENIVPVNQTEESVEIFDSQIKSPLGEEAPAKDEISLLDILIVIARHKYSIFKITLGMTLVTAIVSLIVPVRYKALTSILPPQQSNSMSSALMSQLSALSLVASLTEEAWASKIQPILQVALLREAEPVEDAVVDRFHLQERFHIKRRSDARKRLEGIVDIDSSTKDGLIRISVTDKDPQKAEEMANGYVEEFKKYSAGLAVTEASQRRLFFEQQMVQAKDNLATAEEELKRSEQKKAV